MIGGHPVELAGSMAIIDACGLRIMEKVFHFPIIATIRKIS